MGRASPDALGADAMRREAGLTDTRSRTTVFRPAMLSAPLLLSAALTVSSSAETVAYSGQQNQLKVQIPRLEGPVEVDGVLDEEAWAGAARLTDFSQYSPVDGRPAGQPTEVLVFYSPSAIFFGVRAQAAPGSVRATLARRDQIDAEDSVSIFLSTFNDSRQAMVFSVNPLGVQSDGVLVEGTAQNGNGFGGLLAEREPPDLSPDFVFQSKGHLTARHLQAQPRHRHPRVIAHDHIACGDHSVVAHQSLTRPS